MKSIEIDDDIYNHLLGNVTTLGEDASTVLRRLLAIAEKDQNSTNNTIESAIDGCLTDRQFLLQRKAIDRFLHALSWLYKKHKRDFHMVFTVRGRQRIYFANSKEDINKSGESAYPQKIPDSPYWVITNNDTAKKQRILEDVMRVLGYNKADSNRLARALKV